MRHFIVGLIFLTSNAFAGTSLDHSGLHTQGGTVGGWGLKLQGGSVGGGGGALESSGTGGWTLADICIWFEYLTGTGSSGGSPPSTLAE
jgi:hypothetical protein